MTEIYTDGGCRKNPGIGAWAFAVVENGNMVHSASCAYGHTTNNEMELTAIRQALLYLKMLGITEATIYSDSQYSVNAVNTWYGQWKSRGLLQEKKNVNLIGEIVDLKPFGIRLQWVKGHSSNPFNNLADRLVNEAMDRFIQP